MSDNYSAFSSCMASPTRAWYCSTIGSRRGWLTDHPSVLDTRLTNYQVSLEIIKT